MINQESDTLRIEDILADPIMLAHPTKHCSKTLLMHQLIDPTLMGLDLGEVSAMDVEELTSTVLLAQDWVLNEQAELVAMMEFEQASQSPAQESAPSDEPEYGETLVHITFDSRYLEASILLTEPEEGYGPPTTENLRTALSRRGVICGIKDDYLERLAAHPIYNRPFRIAQGEAPVNGENGKVIYHFEPVFTLAPTIAEDGTADYKALNYVQNVKKGELLCEIIPPTVGVSGFSVRGEMLTGLVGKSSSLTCGRNTTLSEDRRKLYASCDGQVFLKGTTVYVSRVLELKNVDASTGNILFVGTVHVLGDVASGFSIRASSDIVVDGIAENAVLVAGNDIIICGGIIGKGENRDVAVAAGNLRARFIENAQVKATGNVYADVILNSQVESDGSVILLGKRGKLIGGTCTAGATIQAVQIGNDTNLATSLLLHNPDTFGKARAQNTATIAAYKNAISNLTEAAEFAAASNLEVPGPEVMLARAVITKLRMERSIRSLKKQNAETIEQQNRKHQVDVREVIFPNVSITIDEVSYKNMQQKPSCLIVKTRGKLAFWPN